MRSFNGFVAVFIWLVSPVRAQYNFSPPAEAWICNEKLERPSPEERQTPLQLGSSIRVCFQPTQTSRDHDVVMQSIDRFVFSKGDRGINGVQQVIEEKRAVDPGNTNVACQAGAQLCSFETRLLNGLFYPARIDENHDLPPSLTTIQGTGAVSMEYLTINGDRRMLRTAVHLKDSRRGVQTSSTSGSNFAGTDDVEVFGIPIQEQERPRGTSSQTEDDDSSSNHEDVAWEHLPKWGQALIIIGGCVVLLFSCCCCFSAVAFGCWLAGLDYIETMLPIVSKQAKAVDTSDRTLVEDNVDEDGNFTEMIMSMPPVPNRGARSEEIQERTPSCPSAPSGANTRTPELSHSLHRKALRRSSLPCGGQQQTSLGSSSSAIRRHSMQGAAMPPAQPRRQSGPGSQKSIRPPMQRRNSLAGPPSSQTPRTPRRPSNAPSSIDSQDLSRHSYHGGSSSTASSRQSGLGASSKELRRHSMQGGMTQPRRQSGPGSQKSILLPPMQRRNSLAGPPSSQTPRTPRRPSNAPSSIHSQDLSRHTYHGGSSSTASSRQSGLSASSKELRRHSMQGGMTQPRRQSGAGSQTSICPPMQRRNSLPVAPSSQRHMTSRRLSNASSIHSASSRYGTDDVLVEGQEEGDGDECSLVSTQTTPPESFDQSGNGTTLTKKKKKKKNVQGNNKKPKDSTTTSTTVDDSTIATMTSCRGPDASSVEDAFNKPTMKKPKKTTKKITTDEDLPL